MTDIHGETPATQPQADLPHDIQGLTSWAGLLVSVILCMGAAALGALATTPEIDGWYATLVKPSWNPPNFVFGPVWTTLYLMMAVAAWLVWKRGGRRANRGPLALFGIQLLLNVAWSWIFFRAHALGWAVLELSILWVAILATVLAFLARSRVAGILLVPYLAWVSFAGVLNFVIWRLNSTP